MTASTIYLVNPISGHGHLDAYARLYARALTELGHQVVLVAPSDGGTTAYLERNAPAMVRSFRFFSFDALDDELRSRGNSPRANLTAFARARLVLAEEGFSGILDRLRLYLSRIVMRLFPMIGTFLGLSRSNPRISFAPFPPRIHLAREWGRLPEGLIFFLYLDMMAEDAQSLDALNGDNVPPWGGILFHPRSGESLQTNGPEQYLLTPGARGALFLVPEAAEDYRAACDTLSVAVVPDVADLEPAEKPSAIAQSIRTRAGDRTVVLQIGTLTPHKGILDLLEVVPRVDPRRFFFAFVGKVYDETFGDDADRIRDFFSNPPENVLMYNGFIDDERDYNSVVASADVAFAVYRNFPNSSNILTKAAEFNIPLVVSDRYMMGRLIREYDIGIAVPEGNPDLILTALITAAEREWPAENFQAYVRERSIERLKMVLEEAIRTWHGR
ncbi:glycosyltransferase family 4 protein [Rhizobium leguminosarum]|uniref:glycosyltransferase n=1 Tax=Rhizobium leguminosarum TaxID=384 RepID=UPI001C907BB3|nr:glycosyltransferase [Rhizobium leguminosarum]MBY2921238.1 glycosyltransferase family 4 protein [Rhizobium leguminosarum]